MAKRRWSAAIVGVVLIGLLAPVVTRAGARANDLDRMTFVRVNRPVALPGVALAAGTYVFELPDPTGATAIVRVSSLDRRKVYLTTFTRIVERPAGQTAEQPISFGDAPANAPQPITVWWPSREPTGREFIY